MTMRIISLVIAALVFALNTEAAEVEVYRGEPFAEALHDVVLSGAIAIAHQLAQASPTERADVFKLRDGRVLVLVSASEKVGEPYSVKNISVAPSGGDPKKFESVSSLKLPPSVSSKPSR